jgi:exonuclease III
LRLKLCLEDAGFSVKQHDRLDSRSNGLLIAAKEFFSVRSETPSGSEKGELLYVSLECGVRLLAAYFPQGRDKSPFFDRCVAAAAENGTNPLLVIGDFNTGLNDLDVEGSGTKFHCANLFAALSTAGLVDLWRLQNGRCRDWSWRSPLNGFRIDHAFGNDVLLSRYRPIQCWLDHEPRNSGITDHSALLVSWSGPG